MSCYGAERKLAFFYPAAAAALLICCIMSGWAWSHWRYVLNACPETNCGCYLFGRSTYSSFEGGGTGYCYFTTLGPIIPLLFAAVLAIYHGYRVCIGSGRRRTCAQTIRHRTGDMVVVSTESEIRNDSLSPYYWSPATSISAIMSVYMLVYTSIYTRGFNVTCWQYREALLKDMQGIGNIVPVIKSRLSCGAIFDFMDYLVESYSYERRKYGRINTAFCMYATLVCAWLALFTWIAITVVNVINMRRTRPARV